MTRIVIVTLQIEAIILSTEFGILSLDQEREFLIYFLPS